MEEATLDNDKLKRLINIKRSDLNSTQQQEREELTNDLAKKGMLGQGPGNQQLSKLYERQLRELSNILVECYIESIEKGRVITEKLTNSIIQQIKATLNNQSEAFQHLLKRPMMAHRLPESTVASTLNGLKIKANQINKYCEDKIVVEIKGINEKVKEKSLIKQNMHKVKKNRMSSIDIFISHNNSDLDLAERLIDLLRISLNLVPEQIRCTSVDGYRLPGGAKTDEQLRMEVHESKILIGIITPKSMTSPYVLFELGARWGSGYPMIPLLAKGITPFFLKGPLEGINCLSCNSVPQVHQLIDEISKELEIPIQTTQSYQNKVDELVKYSSQFIEENDPIDNQILFEDGVYWIVQGDKKEGPFCQICKDKDNKLIRLAHDEVDMGNGEKVLTRFCRVCGHHQ